MTWITLEQRVGYQHAESSGSVGNKAQELDHVEPGDAFEIDRSWETRNAVSAVVAALSVCEIIEDYIDWAIRFLVRATEALNLSQSFGLLSQ